MMRCSLALSCSGLLLVSALCAEEAPRPARLPPALHGTVDFERDIQPIFARACLSCHGAARHKGGLRLDDRTAALKGGNSGILLKPGDAAHSRLLLIAAGLDADLRMPPDGKTPLTAEELGKLRAWIDQGACWRTTGATTAARSTHWAFQPIRRPALPAVRNRAWVHNEIDAFILARLEKEGIAPSPETDRVTLLRRLSFDLLGLPPSPAEVEMFLHDSRPDAYEQLVDRLLAAPQYGERWGRHWLDAARYADSDGYEKDTGRPFAWRWRNWVLDAFNRDLPFDQLTIEQMAGDLLPGATTEQKVATGFHRNTLTNREGGVDQEQYRVEQVVDRVSTTATVFLGLTMGCARCHDHKYDPLEQRDFYQFFAFFNSDVEANIPAPLAGEEETYRHQKTVFEKQRANLEAALAQYKKEQRPPDKRAKDEKKTDPRTAELTKALAELQKKAPSVTMAQTLALGAPRTTHILIRGDFLRPGAEVHAGTPASLPPLHAAPGRPATRLDLARWLVDPANPLTARVTTNWIWHKYFGRGLVATLEDFGFQGDRPSHPELLDWLASEFVRRQWSMKALHRLIVTSATYRQSSRERPELDDRDPLNVLLARQNRLRLEAEVLRDNALACSGLLARTVGGPSVHPPQPPGISELTYADSAKWVESSGPDRYRRGMYTWFQRTSPYPMLMTFDEPDSNVCCVRRERSNTPLQALTLLNDTVFVECAQALGRRILKETPGQSAPERLRHAFRLCVAREPSADELVTLQRLFESLSQACKARPAEAAKLTGATAPEGTDVAEAATWVAFARALLNLDEFVTRE